MWLILAILSQIVMTAVLLQIPALQKAFGVLNPSASDLALILGFGVVVFVSMEAVKAILRKKMPAVRKGGS